VAQETAEEAWKQLVGETHDPDAYKYVKNNPKLPNVLIYGDSVSVAYTPTVRKELEGKANVYRIYMNGVHSGHLIRCMKKMESTMRDDKLKNPWKFKWDVIIFNVGLHDLRYLGEKGKSKQKASPRVYAKHLRKIVKYLKKTFPDAKLIFTTTTPIPEGCPTRVAGDAAKYNAVALKVIGKDKSIIINDLYAFTKPNQKQWQAGPGNDHFKYEGYTAQGKQTAKIILEALKVK
jgi:hypothetical protein